MSCEELSRYREFLDKFETDNDLLRVKIARYYLTESEVGGEVINMILQYLDENKCPTKLIAPITRNVVKSIESECKKCPLTRGYSYCTQTYEISKLHGLTVHMLETFCQTLLDNVELNKILPSLTDKGETPICVTGTLKNIRRYMEDRHINIDDFNGTYNITNGQKASFYGVFDGHDGYLAAYYAVSQLPYLLATSNLYPSNPPEAMRQAFRTTDAQFVKKSFDQKIRGGTTAVCALYLPDDKKLYVGWVGDSMALLVKQGKIMQIVNPHKPEDPVEKHRIQAAGGLVALWGEVWRVNGCINISRALGDRKYKPYVIGDPDIVGLELDTNEDFLVLGCDGLWDHVAEDKVAQLIYEQLEADCENLNTIPELLIKQAKLGGSTDNITVLVVFLKDPYQIVKNSWTIERMEPAFNNCNIGELTNSEQVLAGNANTQIDFIAEQSKEFFDDHQQNHQQNHQHLLHQFNDGLNNFLQESANTTTTSTTTTTTDVNNPFGTENNFGLSDKINDDDRHQFHQEEFINEFTNSNGQQQHMETSNVMMIDEFCKDDAASEDFGTEICNDVTDDIGMMTTENSEHSTLSHSKDTLPLSDNFNPFNGLDNKAATMLEFDQNDDEFNQVRAHNLNVMNDEEEEKSTPMISPDSEEIMNQGSDGMNDLISPDDDEHQEIVGELATGIIDIMQSPDFGQEQVFNDPSVLVGKEDHQVVEEQEQEQVIVVEEKIENENEMEHNEEMVQHHNEMFGLNSIKENEFETNDVADDIEIISDLDEQNPIMENVQNDCEQQEQQKQFNDEEFGAITEDVQTEEAQRSDMVLEEKFNEHFSSEKNFDSDYMPDVQQQFESESVVVDDDGQHQDLEANDSRQEKVDEEFGGESNIVNGHHLAEEDDNNMMSSPPPPMEHDMAVHEPEEYIEKKTHEEVSGEFEHEQHHHEQIEERHHEQNEEHHHEQIEEHHHEQIEEHHHKEIEENHQQFESYENEQQQVEFKEHLEDDGFVEHEFTEHDNFDAQLEQNVTGASRDGVQPLARQFDDPLHAAIQQDHTESCDESEDEWKYMQSKEGQAEKLVHNIDDNIGVMMMHDELSQSPNPQAPVHEPTIVPHQVDHQQQTLAINHQLDEFSLHETNLTEFSAEHESVNQGLSGISVSLTAQPIDPNSEKIIDNTTAEEDDMNYQLNPEAKEFIPLSPPTVGGGMFFCDDGQLANGSTSMATKFIQPHLAGDDVVAQSPRKGASMNMDEIFVPDQLQFEAEASHRPHEILEPEMENVEVAVVPNELYQELNLKEAMHGSEKEEQILSPSGLQEQQQELQENQHANYHPVAEFENIDMKDSIYIENTGSSLVDHEQEFNSSSEQDMLNHVQLIPDTEESGNSSPNYGNINNKENNPDVENEKEIASPVHETAAVFSENGVQYEDNQHQHQQQQLIDQINNGLNVLDLSKGDAIMDSNIDVMPAKPLTGADDGGMSFGAAACVAVATTATVAGIAKVSAGSETKAEDVKTKKKVAEKNLKNKIDTTVTAALKSPKVPEKKAAMPPISKTSAVPPKKIPSTTSSTTSSKLSTSSKPKTLTVTNSGVQQAPKTLTFPRPRTAPASATTTSNGTMTGGKNVIEKKTVSTTTTASTATTNKSKIDATRPATLTIKKTLSKPSTIESKTSTVKPAVSKTGVTSKPSVTSRVTVSSNTALTKGRASSATGVGTTGTKPTNLRPTTSASSKPVTSPRGTVASTLRKTEAIKVPLKTTTVSTTTTTTTTGRAAAAAGPKTALPATTIKTTTKTTTTRTSGSSATSRTSTAPIRKNMTSSSSLAPGKPSAASIAANQRKPSPIKRPVAPIVAAVVPNIDKPIGDLTLDSTPDLVHVNGLAATTNEV